VRDRKHIEARLAAPDGSRCPRCKEILEIRPITRHAAGHDLECRDCRRYFTRIIQTTPAAMYLFRIQKLATAIVRV
jgi:hypothetical protein